MPAVTCVANKFNKNNQRRCAFVETDFPGSNPFLIIYCLISACVCLLKIDRYFNTYMEFLSKHV